jgi:dephospho-CoA kinase
MADCKRWGLTGGIGSGKSTVAQMLQTLGAAVIDADQIARSLTATGGQGIAAIRHLFGKQAIDAHGAMDRGFMRQLVFAEPDARQRLEGILHPLIGQQTALRAQQAQDQGAPCVVFDVPLLVESGRWRQQVHGVLVVDCEEETQISRVMQRSGLERPAVEQIIAAQASRAQRRAAADCVIYNDGLDLSGLRQQVLSISAWLRL